MVCNIKWLVILGSIVDVLSTDLCIDFTVNEQPTFTGKGTKKAYAKDDASRQYLVANGHQIPDPLEEE